MLILSFLASLYLIEGMLNVFYTPLNQQHGNAANKLGVEFDHRTKLDLIIDLNANDINAVPSVVPASLLKDSSFKQINNGLYPLGGVSDKTTVLGNESGKYAIYQSDRYGFNNINEEWDHEVEWMLTGDSFTQGASVQPGEDIAGQIRLITGDSTINVGMVDNGPLIELAALKEYAEPLKPEKVLWIYYEGNDLGDLKSEKTYPLLLKYLNNNYSQRLINRQKEIDFVLNKKILMKKPSILQYKTRWMRLERVRNFLSHYTNNSSTMSDSSVTIDPLFKEIITKAKSRVEEWGGKFYFVYLPGFQRYSDKINHDKHMKKTDVINIVKNLNIPVIDIHKKVFDNSNDPLSFFPQRIHGHYTAYGYNRVARAIVNSVNKHNKQDNK